MTTAELCGVCQRPAYTDYTMSWDGHCLRGRDRLPNGDDAECFRLGYERLKERLAAALPRARLLAEHVVAIGQHDERELMAYLHRRGQFGAHVDAVKAADEILALASERPAAGPLETP